MPPAGLVPSVVPESSAGLAAELARPTEGMVFICRGGLPSAPQLALNPGRLPWGDWAPERAVGGERERLCESVLSMATRSGPGSTHWNRQQSRPPGGPGRCQGGWPKGEAPDLPLKLAPGAQVPRIAAPRPSSRCARAGTLLRLTHPPPVSARSFAKPPKQVQTVCECILIMKGYKELNWKTAKGMMSDPNFLRSLMEIDFDSITQGQVKNIRSACGRAGRASSLSTRHSAPGAGMGRQEGLVAGWVALALRMVGVGVLEADGGAVP